VHEEQRSLRRPDVRIHRRFDRDPGSAERRDGVRRTIRRRRDRDEPNDHRRAKCGARDERTCGAHDRLHESGVDQMPGAR